MSVFSLRACFVRAILFCSAVAGTLSVANVQAQVAPRQLQHSARLSPGENIPLDGTLDHPAWQRAPEHDGFVEALPVNGGVPAYPTRMRVLVGEQAIYIGVTAVDPQPAIQRAPRVRHDFVDRLQDAVTIYIDPAGRRRAAQFFRVSASGATADGVYTGEDDNEDLSPNFDFDAASVRTASGYTAVFRIPYASLRFARDAAGPWRILVARTVPRDHVYLYVSAAVPAEALSFIATMPQIGGVEPPRDEKFLHLRPNLTVRRSRESTGGAADSDFTQAAGVDLKWRPFAEWVIDSTVNPDFSQVELDTPQLSRNTRFALYFPEKRPFFLESSDLLRSPTDALYTRTVTSPRWGLRASVRGDALSGTAFTGEDRGGGQVLLPGAYGTGTARQPASQLAAGHARVDDGALSFGLTGAARRYEGGRGDNAVFGPDVTWQRGDSMRFRAQALGSYTTALPDSTGELVAAPAAGGSRLFANALMRGERVELNATLADTSASFRNDSGFLAQTGVRFAGADLQRFWRNLGPTNYLALTLNADTTLDRANAKTVSRQITPGIFASWANNSDITLEYHGASRVRVDAASALLEERYAHAAYRTTPAAWAPALSIAYDRGTLADVTANTSRPGERISASAKLRPHDRFELEPGYSVATLQGAGSTVYRESIARGLAIVHLAPRQSLRLILQSTSFERSGEPQFGVTTGRDAARAGSLTYIFRRSAGTALYAGISHAQSGLLPAQTRGNEVFVKLQFDIDEARR